MEIKNGSGDFNMWTNGNMLILKKCSIEDMVKVKTINAGDKIFLLNASYDIIDGVLVVNGLRTETMHIGYGYGINEHDQEATDYQVEQVKKTVFITDDRIYTKVKKHWFKPNETVNFIKNGYYLNRGDISVTYKTSHFKIIE